ncbi:hypothetical protein CR513_05094, partial [Mucuna pruriens]
MPKGIHRIEGFPWHDSYNSTVHLAVPAFPKPFVIETDAFVKKVKPDIDSICLECGIVAYLREYQKTHSPRVSASKTLPGSPNPIREEDEQRETEIIVQKIGSITYLNFCYTFVRDLNRHKPCAIRVIPIHAQITSNPRGYNGNSSLPWLDMRGRNIDMINCNVGEHHVHITHNWDFRSLFNIRQS